MDASHIAEAERLSKYRLALLILAGCLVLAGIIPWVRDVRAQRKQQWFEQLAMDRYRLTGAGKARMRTHLEQELPQDQAQEQITRMNLDKPPVGGRPPEPRTINPLPPTVTWIAFLFAGAAVFASDGIHRRQLALIQAVADARRTVREERERQERDAATPAQPAPRPDATAHAPDNQSV